MQIINVPVVVFYRFWSVWPFVLQGRAWPPSRSSECREQSLHRLYPAIGLKSFGGSGPKAACRPCVEGVRVWVGGGGIGGFRV